MLFSDYFELSDEQIESLHSKGVFDPCINRDNHFFVNIIRMKETTIPEFKEAYQHLRDYFTNIAKLLNIARTPSQTDKIYRSARKMFSFHEVNSINLGFSKSTGGSGWGAKLSNQVLKDAYQIVKSGSIEPEIFFLVGLFEKDIGPDRLSDMIATVIEPDIKRYTLRIMNELCIKPTEQTQKLFQSNGLLKNPYKNDYILLLPIEILHELPIAVNWDDVSRVVYINESIRNEVNDDIGEVWNQWAIEKRKNYLKKQIFMNPDSCKRVIDSYRNQCIDEYDLKNDVDYLTECFFSEFKKTALLKRTECPPTSFEATCVIFEIFKDWVENNRGWALILDAPSKSREKAVQRLVHLGAKEYVKLNDLDISFEADEGRGHLDVKLSRGIDKTIAEIKLSSNSQYLHGFEKQIQEYASADNTKNMVYVYVDVGNPIKTKKIIELYKKTKRSGKLCPELIIIDSFEKKSASVYDGEDDWMIDFEPADFEIEEMDYLEIEEGLDY